MKKFIWVIVISLFFNATVLAQNCVKFVYLNGSNTNDKKMLKWFEKGVSNLHKELLLKFERNKASQNLLLKNVNFYIDEEPSIFYWGDKSQKDLEYVKEHLYLSKGLAPTLAYKVRSLMTAYLHDAIWVQKSHNMLPILDNLNEYIKNENQKGNKIVLFGYSAGTFITYEYLFNNLPYLNLQHLFNSVEVDDKVRQFVAQNPRKDTCIAALSHGDIGVVSARGHILLDQDTERLKANYLKMDNATQNYCTPVNSLKGIVNFASPLVLFYSDIADPDYELTYYNILMIQYIMENGLFYMTLNFKEDPLGFPLTKNVTVKELEEIMGKKFNHPTGLIYDYTGIWSKRPFLVAHTSYWSAKRPFAKALVKSFVKGYEFQYGKK